MPHCLHSFPPRLALALLLFAALLPLRAAAAPVSQIRTYALPAEVRSTHYRVSINGRHADVLHAATGYYLVNFEVDGPVTISVTAEDSHFWDRGVEVQPMRLGIRPVRKGATITFPVAGPGKLTIARPGDHFADADMLFVFANLRETRPDLKKDPQLRYFGPGLHRENIDARSGDRIYLDGGAVVLGSLNVWQVKNVRVFGQGTIVYDGPQDPHTDEGWIHKPNWHCIVMDQAENIEIDGITCITRSRSWQIQMRDSRHIGFYNIKAIGGNPNDANQDGMDWLGGGDTTVRNSFFRASDDVFALQGNWDGYDLDLLKVPGHNVTNITIEDTVTSTSISNTVRVAWPQKTFNSAHFHMSDVDVLHTGFGGCKVPFAFFELWADPDGHGRHEDYSFRDIRLEDWYSLLQIRQPAPEIRDISFVDVWAMDGSAMVSPVVLGDVADVRLDDASLQGFADASLDVQSGAAAPSRSAGSPAGGFVYTPGLLKPGQSIRFEAAAQEASAFRYEWLFGDGTRAFGRTVTHTFGDAQGTLLDGSGRYRVLLHRTGAAGRQSWASQSLVVAAPAQKAQRVPPPPVHAGDTMRRSTIPFHVPADGGYSFTLLTSTKGSLAIDDLAPVTTPKPRAQVCGAEGNAVQPVRVSVALRKGEHHLRVERDSSLENAAPPGSSVAELPLVLWEGPSLPRQVLKPVAVESGAP